MAHAPLDMSKIGIFGPAPSAPTLMPPWRAPGLTGGRPLDQASRSYFEPRFGVDFGKVRVHDDEAAHEAAAALNAHAFTVGNQIAFAEGQHAAGTPAGQHLLAHELAHIAQRQKAPTGARSDGAGQRLADTSLERNADEAASAVLAGRTAQIQAGNFQLGLQHKTRVPEYKQHPCDDKEPTNAKIIGFIRAHHADADAIASQAGVPADWIIAVAAEETEYGTSGIVTRTNNFFGLHVSGEKDTKHFDGQTGAEKTKGTPPVFVAVFSPSTGFLDSGMAFAKIQKERISGVTEFGKFAQIIHEHGYGVSLKSYVGDLMRVHDLIAARIGCPAAK
jgi:flagellum-specific peptidoglycan hydrolase FlgJ